MRILGGDRGDGLRVTTLFDLYGLPDDFPGLQEHGGDGDTARRCDALGKALADDIGAPRFIPYLQRHEVEALVLGVPSRYYVGFALHQHASIDGCERSWSGTLLQFAKRRSDELRWYVRGIDAGGDDPIEWGDEGRATLGKLAEASAFFEAYAAILARPDAIEQGALDETRRLLSETSTICERLIGELMAVTVRVRLEALETSSAMAGRQTDDGVTVGGPLRRVGRNEGCPCGSGKKWKQCCGKPSRLN